MRLKLFNIEDARDYLLTGFILLVALVLMVSRNADGLKTIRRASITLFSIIEEPLAGVRVYRNALISNEELQRTNILLQDELSRLRSVQAENEQYRRMLEFRDTTKLDLLAVKIIGKQLIGVNNVLTINAGSNKGVQKGMALITDKGLVGRVTLTSNSYSEVMPIYNNLFRVSSRIQGSRAYGIVEWDGNSLETLQMLYVPKTVQVDSGQVVETSGFSLEFPPYIPIGKVIKSTPEEGKETQVLTIKPDVSLYTIAEAFVVFSKPDSINTVLINPNE